MTPFNEKIIFGLSTLASTAFCAIGALLTTGEARWIYASFAASVLTKRFRAVTSFGVIEIPAGFLSDGGSIPALAYSIVGTGLGTAGAETHFGVVSSATPTATGAARSISLLDFDIDYSPRFTTDFSQQDFNYR